MIDILIKNGTIVDGTGNDRFRADVAINNKEIIRVAKNIDLSAKEIIDAESLIIAPGFIDIHTHSDLTLLAAREGVSKIKQGVTLDVCGNCGLTAFPLSDKERRKSLSFIDVPSLEWNWDDTFSYIERQINSPTGINRLQLVGYGSIRAKVMGYENRPASEKEIVQIKKILQECFDRGIWGLSIGLGYAPDFYSDTEELIKIAETVKDNDGIFTFHVRGERDTLFNAIDEVIKIARTGVNTEISHLKCSHPSNNTKMPELIEKIRKARENGLNVNFDQYPYTAGNAYLGLLFPPYVHKNGIDGVITLLSNVKTREKIKREMIEGTTTWCSFLGQDMGKNIVISNASGNSSQYVGQRLSDIAKEMQCSVEESACRLFINTKGAAEMLMFQQLDCDLEYAMKESFGLFGSDGFALDDGKLVNKGRPHPRSFGTFPRILSHYVREKHVISLEEAIAKMTLRSALKLGLFDRGCIKEGMVADITIFDSEKIKDEATYNEPMKFSTGIQYLIINGCFVLRNGEITGELPGRFLLKKRY